MNNEMGVCRQRNCEMNSFLEYVKSIFTKHVISFLCIFCCFVLSIHAKRKIPYQIHGNMERNAGVENGEWIFDFNFVNCSNCQIESFTMVFFLFDQEGNSVVKDKTSIVYKYDASIKPKELYSDHFVLDDFLIELPEEPLEVEYLYISIIEYTDGTIWTDPFGLKFF